MKKLILLVFSCMSILVSGQDKISGIQSWIDDDYNNSVYIPLDLSNAEVEHIPLDLSTLPPGRYEISFRFQTDKGKWSNIIKKNINKTLPDYVGNTITHIKYWTNNDKIFQYMDLKGMSVTEGENIGIDLTHVPTGRHKLYMQFLDGNQQWSPVIVKNFLKTPEGNEEIRIAACEYWIDSDYANRQTHVFEQSTADFEGTFNLNISEIDQGGHLLSLRLIDNTGNYSSIKRKYFRKLPEGEYENLITGYRYWFNGQSELHAHVQFDEAQSAIETALTVSMDEYNTGDTVIVSLQFSDIMGGWSAIVSDTVKIGEITHAISLAENSKELMIYPNPAVDEIIIEYLGENKLENATIVIYDIHGKTLINKPLANWSSRQVTVDIQQFIAGVYTLVLKDGKHQFSKRFIKN